MQVSITTAVQFLGIRERKYSNGLEKMLFLARLSLEPSNGDSFNRNHERNESWKRGKTLEDVEQLLICSSAKILRLQLF